MYQVTFAQLRKAKLPQAKEAKLSRAQLKQPVLVLTILDLYGLKAALLALGCSKQNKPLIVTLAKEFAESVAHLRTAAAAADAATAGYAAAYADYAADAADAAAAAAYAGYAADAAAAAAGAGRAEEEHKQIEIMYKHLNEEPLCTK